MAAMRIVMESSGGDARCGTAAGDPIDVWGRRSSRTPYMVRGRAPYQMYGELTPRRRPRDARAHDDHKRSAHVLRARLEPSRRRPADDLHGRGLRLRIGRWALSVRHAPRRARARAPGVRA